MQGLSSGRVPRWVPTAWFLLLLSIFYLPVLTRGETFYAFDILIDYLPWQSMVPEFQAHNELISDPVNQAYPVLKHVDDCYREGHEPYWVPHLFCGMPLPAGAFSSLTSPLIIPLIYLFSPTMVHDVMLALVLALSYTFVYRFLRALHLQRLPAMIGATAWMFNGYVMVWFEFEMVPVLAAALPGFLLGVERWLQKPSCSRALLIVFAGGIAATSGFAHLYIYIALFVMAYALLRVWQSRKELGGHLRRQWPGLLLAGVLLVGVSVPFVVSHFEFVHEGQRKAFPFETLWRSTGRIPAKFLVTLVNPDFYGSPTRGPVPMVRDVGSQIYNNYNEMCLYTGIGALVLAFSALSAIRRSTPTAFFAIAAAVTLTMSMGSYLYYPLWRWVPGLSLTTPLRVLFLFGFCLAILAAFGASQWLNASRPRRWPVAMAALAFAVALGLALLGPTDAGIRWIGAFDLAYGKDFAEVRQTMMPSNFVLYWPVVLSGAILVLVLVAEGRGASPSRRQAVLFLLTIVLAVEQVYFAADYNTTTPRSFGVLESPSIDLLKKQSGPFRVIMLGEFMFNSLSPHGIEDAGGYASIYPERYRSFLALAQELSPVLQERFLTRWIEFLDPKTRLLSLLNIRWMLTEPGRVRGTTEWNLAYRDEVDLAVNPTAFDRVFLTPSSASVATLAEAHAWLRSAPLEQLQQKVLLETAPPLSHRELDPSKAPGTVRLLENVPGRVVAEVVTERPVFLVHSSAYHRDWGATIDGVEAPVLRAYTILQAVAVPPGRHEVVLRFEATTLKRSLYAGYSAWGLLLFSVLVCAVRRRKGDHG